MLRVWCALGFVCWSLAANARAQYIDAQAEFERGMAAYNAGHFQAALAAFDASYRRQPRPATLYEFGVTYTALELPYKALESYASFLRAADPSVDKAKISEAEREIGRIHKVVARFVLKLAPPDARIDIDGQRVGVREGELWVFPGTHTISIRAPGYDSYAQTLEVQTGRYALEINLHQNIAPPQEQADALIDEGLTLAARGDRDGALASLQSAQAVLPTPRGFAELGLLEDSAGDLASAQDHITSALAWKKSPYIRKNRLRLRKTLTRLKQKTRNYAKLTVRGEPQGAELFLGDHPAGSLTSSTLLRVPPGHVLLIARQDGYEDATFEARLLPKSSRIVELQLLPLPPLPPPPSPPKAAVQLREPAPGAPLIAAEPVVEVTGPADNAAGAEPGAADRNALAAELRDQGREPEDHPVHGFELNALLGYQTWLGDGPWGSTGGLAARLSLGLRMPWPLSFGITLLDVSMGSQDPDVGSTYTINPGLYVRLHTQRIRRKNAVDVWFGSGFSPFTYAVARFDENTNAQQRLAGVNPEAIEQVLADGWDVGRTSGLRSMTLPIDLGLTWYVTRGVGLTLNAGLTFWFPMELCYSAGGSQHCTSKGLDSQRGLFVGAGLSLLP